jgi:hypothetical protein
MAIKTPLFVGLNSLLLAFVLAGCDRGLQDVEELSGIELHQPGRYLGKDDPLLERAGTPELANQLAERLQSTQTDR